MLASLVLAGAGTLPAQTLAAGAWSGKITPPDSPSFPVTLKVTADGDTVRAELHWQDFGVFGVSEIAVTDARLTFTLTFDENEAVWCDLARRDDGVYAGECVNEDGEPGSLTLRPPSTGRGGR